MNFQLTTILSILFIALFSLQSCTSESLEADLQIADESISSTSDCMIDNCTTVEIEIDLQSQKFNSALTCFEWQSFSSRTALDMDINWEENTLTLSFNNHQVCGTTATLSSPVISCEKSLWENIENYDSETVLVFDLTDCLSGSDYLMVECVVVSQ